MKALVTGGTGFIGCNIVRALIEEGIQVRVLMRRESSALNIEDTGVEKAWGDVRDTEAVRDAVGGCDAVFHTAALYRFWAPKPNIFYDINVQGTKNVLEAALSEGVSRLVYTSTVGTIGVPRHDRPSTEEDYPRQEELYGHYKRSKFQAEAEAVRLYERGLPVVIVNPTAPVGRGDVKPTPTGRIILDFLKGRMPAYLNTGLNLVDVEDVAKAHVLAMKKGQAGQRYILGNRNMTLKETLDILAEITKKQAPRVRIPFWLALGAGYGDYLIEGGVMGREPFIPLEGVKIARHPMYVDCSKAVRELGMPQTPVHEALEKAVEWFQEKGYA
ncbi:MAG: NAD-dependent epimerase/dehydratase family protein [Chloroflexi bacterium]|nr:NAD-dependent epimerase/dehydratase family protein [Chloroflexota bacterium]